jgi:hypothetical protein
LRNNNLTQLPEELVHCAELKMIDLRGNPISAEELSKWNAVFNDGVKIKTD